MSLEITICDIQSFFQGHDLRPQKIRIIVFAFYEILYPPIL